MRRWDWPVQRGGSHAVRVFSTLNSKQGGGAYGLLTNGLMTRESIYTQTLILALIPFVHELWNSTSTPNGDDLSAG